MSEGAYECRLVSEDAYWCLRMTTVVCGCLLVFEGA